MYAVKCWHRPETDQGDKVKKGKGRVVNARFYAMCSHYLFDPDFCNVASGWGEAGFRNTSVALPQPARCANRAVERHG